MKRCSSNFSNQSTVLSVASNLVTSTYCQKAAATGDFLVRLDEPGSFSHIFIFKKFVKQRPAWFSDERTLWPLFYLCSISLTHFINCLEGDSWIKLEAEDGITIMLCVMPADALTLVKASQTTGLKNKYFFVLLEVCHKSHWNNLSWPGFSLACSNTMPALCLTLWPQSASHKMC